MKVAAQHRLQEAEEEVASMALQRLNAGSAVLPAAAAPPKALMDQAGQNDEIMM